MRTITNHRWVLFALLPLMATSANAQPAHTTGSQCFVINQLEDWRAPDTKTIYIRVLLNKYYRLDLSAACPDLKWPESHLITNTRGPDTVCSAVDWDLKVAPDLRGIPEPCIVKTMTLLTPDEVAAIPKKFKP